MAAPRIFSLQRLVEVADFNMDSRSRIVWSDIWKILSNHFARIGSHDNPQVAMYAIDSLRQLAQKFTAKEELRDFNFQRLFMKPFETIMSTSPKVEIREFVLRCTEYLMRSRLPTIRSGWKSIFAVHSIAAKDSHADIAKLAWDTIEDLSTKHVSSLKYEFLELIKCLLAFVEGPREELALSAVELIGSLTQYLSQEMAESVYPTGHSHLSPLLSDEMGNDSKVLHLWWPVLFGLSENVGSRFIKLRHLCLNTLFTILSEHGKIFSTQTWSLLLKGVLAPMMEEAATDMTSRVRSITPESDAILNLDRDKGWVVNTAPKVLNLCGELFILHFEKTKPLLPEMMAMLQSSICQANEILARIAVNSLRTFMIKLEEMVRRNNGGCGEIVRSNSTGNGRIGQKFTVWDCLASSLSAILTDNSPTEVLEEQTSVKTDSPLVISKKNFHAFRNGPKSPNLDALMTMLVVGVRVVPLIEGLVCCHSESVQLSNQNLDTLLNVLEWSASVCRRFNNNFNVRRALGKSGFMAVEYKGDFICSVLKQELLLYKTLLNCLILLSGVEDGMKVLWERAPLRLGRTCKMIVSVYAKRECEMKRIERSEDKRDLELLKGLVEATTPAVIMTLKIMQELSDEHLSAGNEEWLYDALVGLITCDSLEVRNQVHVLFMTRIKGRVKAASS